MASLSETNAHRCVHAWRGCKWRGLETNLNDHLKICAFEQLSEYMDAKDKEIQELKLQLEQLQKKITHLTPNKVSHITLQGHTSIVVALGIWDKILFSGSMDGTLKLWDMFTYTVIREISLGPVFSLKLASGYMFSGHTNEIKVWDLTNYMLRSTLSGHSGNIKALCIYGNRLYSGCADKTIKVWDLDTAECLTTIDAHSGEVRDIVDISDDKTLKYLVSCSDDTTIKVWNSNMVCEKKLTTHKAPVRALLRIADVLFSGSDDTYIKIWNLKTFDEINTISALVGVTSLVASYSGSTPSLVSGHTDGVIKIWNLSNLENVECELLLTSHINPVRCLVVAGNALISGGYDRTIKLWTPRG